MAALGTLSDMELLDLLKSGSQAAFKEIYARYWQPLYLHAYHMLGDEDEAQDIIQELFIAFWHKPESLSVHTSLKSFLYAATRNRVLNQIRKSKTNQNFIQLLGQGITEKDFKTVEDIDLKELTRIIDEEVQKLPQRMREVFELSRKNFLTHKEIAAQLGTSEETVKKQISNSLRVLRLKLQHHHLLVAALFIEAMKR
jgi:RNA polymerase sigma-70 factor (family 1)